MRRCISSLTCFSGTHAPLASTSRHLHCAARSQFVMQQLSDSAVDPNIVQARRKFASLLENTVLDYKHYHPVQLEACINTLDLIIGNVVSNPDDPKYRRFKAANKKYLANVASIKHTEELLLQAGWRPKVVEMEKSWVFEAAPDSLDFRKLVEFHGVLQRAQATIHAKAERKAKEDEERKSRHASERERILLALEDDRGQRQLLQEAKVHLGPAKAQQLPSEASQPGATGGEGAEFEGDGDEDDEDDDEDEDNQDHQQQQHEQQQHQQPGQQQPQQRRRSQQRPPEQQ